MADRPLILALDQGTTSSRAIVFDAAADIVAVARQAMRAAEAKGGRVVAVGIANQRETALVWERASGRPIYNAIVWQDRRTADHCRKLAHEGAEATIQARTGLLLDPYFSAAKVGWILDRVEGARGRAAM